MGSPPASKIVSLLFFQKLSPKGSLRTQAARGCWREVREWGGPPLYKFPHSRVFKNSPRRGHEGRTLRRVPEGRKRREVLPSIFLRIYFSPKLLVWALLAAGCLGCWRRGEKVVPTPPLKKVPKNIYPIDFARRGQCGCRPPDGCSREGGGLSLKKLSPQFFFQNVFQEKILPEFFSKTFSTKHGSLLSLRQQAAMECSRWGEREGSSPLPPSQKNRQGAKLHKTKLSTKKTI